MRNLKLEVVDQKKRWAVLRRGPPLLLQQARWSTEWTLGRNASAQKWTRHAEEIYCDSCVLLGGEVGIGTGNEIDWEMIGG